MRSQRWREVNDEVRGGRRSKEVKLKKAGHGGRQRWERGQKIEFKVKDMEEAKEMGKSYGRRTRRRGQMEVV